MKENNPINSIFNLEFSNLYNREGLLKIDEYFLQFVKDFDENLYEENISLRENCKGLEEKLRSEFLIKNAKVLENFLALFFNIKAENENLFYEHLKFENFYTAKRIFIQRRVVKKYQNFEGKIPDQIYSEIELANQIAACLSDEENHKEKLEELEKYCAFAIYHPEGVKKHKNWVLFHLPKKIDFENLIECEKSEDGIIKAEESKLENREGFKLTDFGCNTKEALDQTNYCIFCHNQGKDSCRKGLREKDNSFKKNPLGAELSGCPLDEKISEMNILKNEGKSIAALAVAIIDNPMIAGTGHRICNDCMKSCIYQKQEPVNIPQIETRTLKDVLNLPFGFEIYSLLTRWNPLNLERPIEKDKSGYKVLVAGLGPAGYTLAHHLLNEGHLVIGVDGLKIEPLSPEISGIDLFGNRHDFKPIKDINEIYEELDERNIGGFGGVAEYGITVRWDKNFLKIIRLLLERRKHFRMFGGFRLGSGLDCYDALKEYDFDHVALCLGAGWAKIPEIKNNFLKGIRMASDFLMALQLTGAERKNLPSNLQLRLPVIVVGSGLTAIDTAVESLAYYPRQIENFANHYEFLCTKIGKENVEKSWSVEEKIIAEEFLKHHKIILAAKTEGKNITKIVRDFGGAKILYRRQMKDSPAYRLNHEEVQKAFEEGIEFIENGIPIEAIDDGFGQIKSLKISFDGNEKEIACKSLFLAAGTTPNKAPFYEDKLKFALDGITFQINDLLGNKLPAIGSPKGENIGFICAKNDQGKMVSFFGDLHPSFNGSVVKAMASAKNGYPIINDSLKQIKSSNDSYDQFLYQINYDFGVKIKEINILSNHFIEIVVHAPSLARKTKLGHIFRMHNFHALAKENDHFKMAMEGVAVTTYKVDQTLGTITVMIVDVGGSSSILKNLKIGEPIIFMGPTGVPSHIYENKNVVLIAGGRGIFPLAALGEEYKKRGCHVTLFCGFRKTSDIIRKEELQNSCNKLIISVDEETSQNQFFQGNIAEKVKNYFQNSSEKIDVVLTMGNDEMMHKISDIYHNELKKNLNDAAIGITSLNNPMQCMLKGVCSQCLQKKTDSKTGQIRYFYACVQQDQRMSDIDFTFLKNRCGQNSLSEKLTRIYLQNLN